MNASENLNSINKYKFNMRIIIGIIVIFIIMTALYMVFADSSVRPEIRPVEGVPYMYFELEHNLSNAQYKYYGYGYTVSVYEPGPNGKLLATEYLHNAQFKPYMDGSTEKVWIPMEEIYSMVKLDDEFYSVRNMKVYLNGRLGIKVNGKLTHLYDSHEGSPENGLKETGLQTGYWKEDGLTVPLNKDGQGIANGIKHEYGVSWTPITYTNLRQHFGIPLTVPAVYKYDRYRVEYREVSSKKTVSSEKPYQNFEDVATITEYPVMVNGYEYSGQYMIKKIDTDNSEVVTAPYGDTQQGDSATINIKKNADRYIITFYYTKVDPSTIGNPVTINVEYRENDSNGKKLLDNTSTIGGDLSQFNFNSAKIDDYTCKGHFVMGQATEYFYTTKASFIIGKEDYSKPVDGKLKLVFIYEKTPYVSIPKCDPSVYGDADTVNISMKKKDFENATDISINNAVFKIDDFRCGKDKNGDSVEGTHEFNYFDLYVDKYVYSYDNKLKQTTQSFIVPKNIFTQSTTDTNLYTANIDVTYAAFCTCFDGKPDSNGNYGMAVDNGSISININLIENKPPNAYFDYYTEKTLENGDTRTISKAYIDRETIINNQATDPNGAEDIKTLKYTLKDSNSKQYYVNLLMVGNGTYFLDDDNINANNILFQGITDNGDLKIKFLTSDTWTITQYVEDSEGLNDTYEATITPEILSLKPLAVISDVPLYRYPRENAFNGKQNRAVQYNSNSSYVCDYLKGTGVNINHNRDCWEIIPLDGQSFDSIKFEYDVDSKIIDGVLQVKYTPLNNIKMMFKEKGLYKFRLQVSDTDGNVSEWAEQVIIVNEDLKPTISADLNPKYYRNTSKVAKISFYALPQSLDKDLAFIDSIGYKFDSNNNGNFTDETLNTTGITSNEVNIDGYIYTHITLDTNKVGKYQFIINAKENFNQETIDKYIIATDYKSASIVLQTEIDNMQPVATLGTQKINNIDVKVITSGLTGTKNSDVQVNLSNLKNQLESQPNIKVGDIEVIDLANRVNGLLDENSLTWRRVTMGGWISGKNFPFIEKDPIPSMPPETPLVGNWIDPLPYGIYADGWNGLTVPKLLINGDIHRLYSDVNHENRYGDVEVKSDFYLMDYKNNYVEIGNLEDSMWGAELGDVSDFSAVTNEKIKDFDIGFTFTDSPKGFPGNPLDKHIGDRYLLFNIKDKNNYHAYFDVHYNYKYDGESWATDYFDENITSGFLRIVNGKKTNIRLYFRGEGRIGHHDDDYNYDIRVNRLMQVGNSLKAYDTEGKIALDLELEDGSTGGYLGLAATAALSMNTVRLNINNLSYIGNSNIGEAVDRFNWDSDSDKYIINLAEGNKLEELTNQNILNKTATKLQEKEINIINVGVNAINGSKLKEITTKNLNNGTYFELGNISSNFNSSANYIKAKYINNSDTGDIYVLLDDNLSYTENYTDAELDTKFLSEYKYSQNAAYFENNLGIINNNNTWIKEPMDITNKTGKYTVSFRVKDNPLYPDTSIFNLFDSYRKYSEEFKKNIYVHRKPISSFSVDNSFVKNLLNQYSQNYDSIWLRLRMPPNPNAWDIVYDYDDYNVYNDYTWFFKYFGLNSRSEYRDYYRNLDNDWRYYGEDLIEPICDPNDYDFYYDNRSYLKSYFNIRSYSAYQSYFEDRLDEYYDNIEYRGDLNDSVIIDVNIPSNAINATLHYKTPKEDDDPYTRILADGVEIERVYDNVEKTISVPNGTQKLEFNSSGNYWNSGDSIDIYDIYTHYYLEDTNINIPINECSYDLDHLSISNKGIVEWQWKIVNRDGITSLYNTTNRVNGTNWVSTQLKNQQWHDSTIFLRVKDLEGAYSDWTSTFISEKNLLDPGTNNDDITAVKPIANFLIDKDPLKLNAETQIITDSSYDKDGYTLTNIWNVYKEDNFLFMSTQKNINTQLNDEIKKNGVGNYIISLKVVNSKGIYSDTVTKPFRVTIYNDEPTVNFNLVSNENPAWTFPKTLGLYTLRYRPTNTLFSEEYARFDTYINDPNTDNTGFIYNWKLERFAVKDINNISGAATNTYNYTTQFPFTNSFKNQGLGWGAYRVTLKVTDKPPIPPYTSTDAKSAEVTKNYYIVPEISLLGSFESGKSEIMVGDSIKLKAKTNKTTDTVGCSFNSTGYALSKVSEDSNYAYWEKNITIPENITESGTYQLQFIGKTTYGGNGNVTREVSDNVHIDIVALKLINFRITNIVNHPYITFPYTKNMLLSALIPYKTGYYVTFQIDSKGKPDNLYGRIDVGNNGITNQVINMTKVVTGDTETWRGRFYSSAHLTVNTVISIKLDCSKGSVTYNYNEKENWDGRSLIVNGSALQDGKVNLTN